MKKLKNWENKTWLSSTKYIQSFCKFLKSKNKINKSTRILDIGCGRANVISYLNKKYKFFNKPIGIDIFKSKFIKKNIIFKKSDAIYFLKGSNEEFDLILIKQTIHLLKLSQIKVLLAQLKKNLNSDGKIFILTLNPFKNEIPSFKLMKKKLIKSLKRDKNILSKILELYPKSSVRNFSFKVKISKKKYNEMILNRYISTLLNFSKKQIFQGINEINLKYKKNIEFNDKLICIIVKNK